MSKKVRTHHEQEVASSHAMLFWSGISGSLEGEFRRSGYATERSCSASGHPSEP